MLVSNDLIITMETSHKSQILSNFYDIEGIEEKVFTLKEFNGERENLDIIDPYYTNSKIFREILKIIDENVEELIKRVVEINQPT